MQNEIVIRTNEAGEPDMDFYLREAQMLREQALVDTFTSLTSSIAAAVRFAKQKLNFSRQPSFGTLLGH